MNVLAIGSDRSILHPKSASAERQIAYGAHFDSLNIIIFSLRRHALSMRVLSVGVHAYPTASRLRLFYGIDALLKAFHIEKPDVVSAQDPFEAGLVSWCIARMRGSALHVQVHTDVCAPSFRASSILNALRYRVARFVLQRADHIRVVSSHIQEDVYRDMKPRAQISVLPIFTDIAKFKNAYPGELAHRFRNFGKKILVVARLEKEKNVMLALGSFAHVAKATPRPESVNDACLIIVGDGAERRALENRAKELGVKESVFFEGTQDALPYYALADLVVVPSLFEGYGLVIVEALAAGKPVLSTDVGIARESGALIAEPEKFSEALEAWFEYGPHHGTLQHYPYDTFEAYTEAYARDITSAVIAR